MQLLFYVQVVLLQMKTTNAQFWTKRLKDFYGLNFLLWFCKANILIKWSSGDQIIRVYRTIYWSPFLGRSCLSWRRRRKILKINKTNLSFWIRQKLFLTQTTTTAPRCLLTQYITVFLSQLTSLLMLTYIVTNAWLATFLGEVYLTKWASRWLCHQPALGGDAQPSSASLQWRPTVRPVGRCCCF